MGLGGVLLLDLFSEFNDFQFSRLECNSIVNLPLRGRLWDAILAPQGDLGGPHCVCGVLWYQNVGKGRRKVASSQNLGGPKGPLDR